MNLHQIGMNGNRTDRNGLIVTISYDKLDRMTGKKYADLTKESYAYDEVGNVTEQVSTGGAKTIYGYDNRNRNIYINGFKAEIRIFIKGGGLINFDMFKGWSNDLKKTSIDWF